MPTQVSGGHHQALRWLIEQVDAELFIEHSPVSRVGICELVDDGADACDQVADLLDCVPHRVVVVAGRWLTCSPCSLSLSGWGFRITTRFFENPEAPLGTDLEPLKEPYGAVSAAATMTVCFSAGLGICSSIGWGTDLPGGPTLPPPIIHDGLETEHPKPEHP